jgi:hypothetical protein
VPEVSENSQPSGGRGQAAIGEAETPSRMISTRDLLEPIYMKTFYIGVIVPLLFACLGSSGVFASYVGQAHWLINSMASLCPALPPEFELILKIRGPGHAASFGFFSAALWLWPVICAALFLRGYASQMGQILPISAKETVMFIFVLPLALFCLLVDTTISPTFVGRFRADKLGFFYLKSWFLFSLVALVIAIVIYLIGRAIINWRVAHVPI